MSSSGNQQGWICFVKYYFEFKIMQLIYFLSFVGKFGVEVVGREQV